MFNKSNTQFLAAMLVLIPLGTALNMMIWGAINGKVDMALAMAAMNGLSGLAGTAFTWLFRLNGQGK